MSFQMIPHKVYVYDLIDQNEKLKSEKHSERIKGGKKNQELGC